MNNRTPKLIGLDAKETYSIGTSSKAKKKVVFEGKKNENTRRFDENNDSENRPIYESRQ